MARTLENKVSNPKLASMHRAHRRAFPILGRNVSHEGGYKGVFISPTCDVLITGRVADGVKIEDRSRAHHLDAEMIFVVF